MVTFCPTSLSKGMASSSAEQLQVKAKERRDAFLALQSLQQEDILT